MPLFKKKPPPIWFVLRPQKSSSSSSDPQREGPYTRATIIQMYGEGMLGDGALIWTNEKIFPNAAKPNSFRLVRIMEWRRLDQLPDPVIRQFDAEWHEMQHQQHNPTLEGTNNTDVHPAGYYPPHEHHSHPTSGTPPPPTGGTPNVIHPQSHRPTSSSMYPTGTGVHQTPNAPQTPDQSSHSGSSPSSPPFPPPQIYPGPDHTPQQPSAPYPQNPAFPQPTAYPAAAAYPPPPAPGAY